MAPLEIRTFPGAGGGMDLVSPVHMLADSKARWVVDAFLDKAGLVRQRGKLKAGSQKDTRTPYGIMASYTPDNIMRIGIFVSDDVTNNAIKFFDKDNTGLGEYAVGGNFSARGSAPTFWYTKPLLNKPGQVVSFMYDPYSTSLARALGLWRGGTKANYSTGTITVSSGTKSVAGSGTTWSTNVTSGMHLLADLGSGSYRLIGVVSGTPTNTAIALEEPALFSVTGGNYLLTSIRGLNFRTGVGHATATTGSAVVNGTGTKFNQMAGGSTWAIFRQRDLANVGTVTSIQSDTQLTLTANANVELTTADKYFGILLSHTYTFLSPVSTGGYIPCVWQGRMFYANGYQTGLSSGQTGLSRLWYSDTDDPEVMDLTEDGWNLDIPSTESATTPILGLYGLEHELLIFKESEVWSLQGTADPATWEVKRLTNNGVLAPNAIQGYQGGVVWPSDAGILYYDGTTVRNLTADSLGDFWIKSTSTQSPQTANMWSMVERDHYFLSMEGSMGLQYGYFKASTEVKPSSMTWCVNIPNESIVMLNNIGIRGSISLLATGSQEATARFIVKKGSDSSTYIVNAKPLFFDEGTGAIAGGVDDFVCAGGYAIGPDFYVESARYDMDDPQIRKLWKQVQIWYASDTLPLHLDVVTNFDDIGVQTQSALAANATMIDKRLKFLKRAQLLGFRLYSRLVGSNTPSGFVQLGPWAMGFKRQRPGRV